MIDFPLAGQRLPGERSSTANGHGYLARPAGGAGSGLLLLHAWWGLNDAFRQMCDGLASEGFVVLAPDFYGAGQTAATIDEAERLSGELDATRAEEIVMAAADRLGEEVSGRLGVVGFSLGAYLALRLADTRADRIAGVVLFYGTGPAGEGPAPVLGHFAADDPYEPAEEVAALESRLRAAGRLAALHRYDGVEHWFAEPDRPQFDAAASELAWQRTLAFLRRRLGGA